MKQKFKNTQKGITLVALVITIIVLLILAMVSIRIVMDEGLISKVKDATAQHTIAAEKEAITTGYAAYQMALANKENVTKPTIEEEATVTPKGEDWSVTFTKTNNEYELKKDGTITLTKQGNGSTTTVGWTDNGNDTFTKGDVTLKVGDIVNYDEGTGYSTTVTASKSGYTDVQTYTTENLGWRVLGINTKGEIELISDNPTSSNLWLYGETGYLNAEEVLNNMCNELYGKGEHAIGARSLNVEDINKLGNYDPTTSVYDDGYDNYGNGNYGDIWTYRFPTTGDYMQVKKTKADGTLKSNWTNITAAYGQTFKMPGETEEEKISADNRNDTGRSIEYTHYNYKVANKVKQTTSDGKKMSDIISNGTKTSCVEQWLASRCVSCVYGAAFYVRKVDSFVGDSRGINVMCKSDDDYSGSGSGQRNYYVRPVVTLKSDIKLSGNSNDGWTIN